MSQVETLVVAPVKVNKSKHIVDFLKEKGIETPANDIIEALTAQGVLGVTAQLINNIKHRLRASKAAKARKRKVTVETPVVPPQNEYEQMLAVKALAVSVGGFDKLADLIERTRKLAA